MMFLLVLLGSIGVPFAGWFMVLMRGVEIRGKKREVMSDERKIDIYGDVR